MCASSEAESLASSEGPSITSFEVDVSGFSEALLFWKLNPVQFTYVYSLY